MKDSELKTVTEPPPMRAYADIPRLMLKYDSTDDIYLTVIKKIANINNWKYLVHEMKRRHENMQLDDPD